MRTRGFAQGRAPGATALGGRRIQQCYDCLRRRVRRAARFAMRDVPRADQRASVMFVRDVHIESISIRRTRRAAPASSVGPPASSSSRARLESEGPGGIVATMQCCALAPSRSRGIQASGSCRVKMRRPVPVGSPGTYGGAIPPLTREIMAATHLRSRGVGRHGNVRRWQEHRRHSGLAIIRGVVPVNERTRNQLNARSTFSI